MWLLFQVLSVCSRMNYPKETYPLSSFWSYHLSGWDRWGRRRGGPQSPLKLGNELFWKCKGIIVAWHHDLTCGLYKPTWRLSWPSLSSLLLLWSHCSWANQAQLLLPPLFWGQDHSQHLSKETWGGGTGNINSAQCWRPCLRFYHWQLTTTSGEYKINQPILR